MKRGDVTEFCLVAEDTALERAVKVLTDRLLCELQDWIEEGPVLDGLRRWSGLDSDEYFPLSRVKERAERFRRSIWGRFNGNVGARQFRLAILLFVDRPNKPGLLVIAQDLDDEPKRRAAFLEARAAGCPFPVVLAAPQPEAEAWFVAAYQATDVDRGEQELTLGFNPFQHPHRLKSTARGSSKDAKKVLAKLSPDPSERELLLKGSWGHLLRHGRGTVGLCEFVEDTKAALDEVFPELKER